jgi:hypothetical protein
MPILTSTPNILVEPQVKVGPPEFTPTPYINTVDLALNMSMKDKVEIWILTADGEKKRFIAPPEIHPESLMESGDTLFVIVPPASSRRVPPGPPTQLPACNRWKETVASLRYRLSKTCSKILTEALKCELSDQVSHC